uniref:Uncharacterized protein n=1 Tax=Salix viminalis TaxID=40686 RepID=A0A6N2M0C3_SALVM
MSIKIVAPKDSMVVITAKKRKVKPTRSFRGREKWNSFSSNGEVSKDRNTTSEVKELAKEKTSETKIGRVDEVGLAIVIRTSRHSIGSSEDNSSNKCSYCGTRLRRFLDPFLCIFQLFLVTLFEEISCCLAFIVRKRCIMRRNYLLNLLQRDEKGSPQTIATPPEVEVQAQAWFLLCNAPYLQRVQQRVSLLSITRCSLANGIFCCFTRRKIFSGDDDATSECSDLVIEHLNSMGCSFIVPHNLSIPFLVARTVARNNEICSLLVNDEFITEGCAVGCWTTSFDLLRISEGCADFRRLPRIRELVLSLFISPPPIPCSSSFPFSSRLSSVLLMLFHDSSFCIRILASLKANTCFIFWFQNLSSLLAKSYFMIMKDELNMDESETCICSPQKAKFSSSSLESGSSPLTPKNYLRALVVDRPLLDPLRAVPNRSQDLCSTCPAGQFVVFRDDV